MSCSSDGNFPNPPINCNTNNQCYNYVAGMSWTMCGEEDLYLDWFSIIKLHSKATEGLSKAPEFKTHLSPESQPCAIYYYLRGITL